jgi:hypothetical protein
MKRHKKEMERLARKEAGDHGAKAKPKAAPAKAAGR